MRTVSMATSAVICLALLSSAPASANAGGAITIDVPEDFPTIQAAINAALAGDTVSVAPGTYFENVVLKEDVDLVGSGADITTIDGKGTSGTIVLGARNSRISDFTIRNASLDYYNNIGAGIRTAFPMTIRRNWITNCRIGIATAGSSTIERNVIVNNPGLVGIYVQEGAPLIRNNTIAANLRGIQAIRTSAPRIVNNIVVDNPRPGIVNFGSGMVFVAFNDVFENNPNYDRMSDQTGSNGNLSLDPLFVDPIAGDYRLRANSPLIDAGDPLGSIDPDGTVADIGAIPFDQDSDRDGVLDAEDRCPETVIPERLVADELGHNRWALVDADLTFDTTATGGWSRAHRYDTAQTGGCSCEQIIRQLHVGAGAARRGCSPGNMHRWIAFVASD